MELMFTFVIGVMIYSEYKMYETLITPFSIISTVYSVLILINNYIAIKFGFYKVAPQSIVYILCFLIVIFIISKLSCFSMKKKYNKEKVNLDEYVNNIIYKNSKLIVVIFLIGLISRYINLAQIISIYGISNIKGKAFGIFAHIGTLSIILSPYILLIYMRDKKKIIYPIMIALVYLALFISGGKYLIMIAFMHLILFYALIRDVSVRKVLKLAMYVVFFSLLMFIIVYVLKPMLTENYFDKNVFMRKTSFAFRHFLFYLLSPVIATNYYFVNSVDLTKGLSVLFTVPINIFKAIFGMGNYVSPVIYDLVPVSETYHTNVGGLFAESVYNSNFLIALFYIGAFFAIVYYFYNKSMYRGSLLGITSLLLAIISMMFFGNFLTVSGAVFQILFLGIIELFLYRKSST